MARSQSIPHKIATLIRVGPHRQWLVAEAAASLFFARVTILVRPFGATAKGFGDFVSPDDPRVRSRAAVTNPEQARIARQVGWAVRSTAPYMPFRSVCLQQAMAAHAMLRRRGVASVMHFGAGKGTGANRPIDAHAWLDAAGAKVTGYPVAANLVELGCFV